MKKKLEGSENEKPAEEKRKDSKGGTTEKIRLILS
jgi:hypothetical protein